MILLSTLSTTVIFFGDFIVDSATLIDKGTGTCSIAYSSNEFGRSTALTVRLFLGAVLSVVFRLGSSVVRVRWFPPFSSAASDDMSSLPCPYIKHSCYQLCAFFPRLFSLTEMLPRTGSCSTGAFLTNITSTVFRE